MRIALAECAHTGCVNTIGMPFFMVANPLIRRCAFKVIGQNDPKLSALEETSKGMIRAALSIANLPP